MKQNLLKLIVMCFGILACFSITSSTDNVVYASYYHDKFNGRKTASGEVFNNSDFTVAHKSLKFKTKVKITNLRTNKSVVVRVNDRGPYVKTRTFDLSKAAYQSIGNIDRGVMPVTYEILTP